MSSINRDDLVSRWAVKQDRRRSVFEDIELCKDWTRNILDLPFVDTCPRERLPDERGRRDLRGIRFANLDLTDSDALAETSLDWAIFDNVVLTGASLNGSSLRGAIISSNCVLDGASLQFSDLYGATIVGVSMQGCDLTGANIVNVNFQDSDLRQCLFRGVKHREEGVLGFLKRRSWTRFGGEFQRTSDINPASDPYLLHYISGESLRRLVELRHPLLAKVWYLLANFGRSPTRLMLWAVAIWLAFGFVYAGYPVAVPFRGTPIEMALESLSPDIEWAGVKNRSPSNAFEPYYFSAVTFATLGFGDTHPTEDDWKGEVYVCLEVFFGYTILGIFV